MARYFIATLNYAPEPTGFAPRVALLAEHLARVGHDVQVFTGFPFAPHWHRRPSDRGRLVAREQRGGATVTRVTHFIPRRPSSDLQRMLMEGSFGLAVFLAIAWTMFRGGRPDAFVAHGAQPAVAILARVMARLAGRPYFVNVTDLAARLARDVGIVGPRLHALLEACEFAAYRKAAGVSVLCRSFADALEAHAYPRERIRIVPDPIDVELIRPVPRDAAFRARHGIPESAFVILHAGSMSRKVGLATIVAAAERTRGTTICWVLVGDGEAKPELVDAVRAAALDDVVRFVPFQPDEELSHMFAAADVLVLAQLHTVTETVIPSKLLTYLAAGRPVLAAVHPASEAAQVVADAGGGRIVAPEDPDALAAAAHWYRAQTAETLAAFGARNRAYAEDHFDQRKVLASYEQFLQTGAGLRAEPASAA